MEYEMQSLVEMRKEAMSSLKVALGNVSYILEFVNSINQEITRKSSSHNGSSGRRTLNHLSGESVSVGAAPSADYEETRADRTDLEAQPEELERSLELEAVRIKMEMDVADEFSDPGDLAAPSSKEAISTSCQSPLRSLSPGFSQHSQLTTPQTPNNLEISKKASVLQPVVRLEALECEKWSLDVKKEALEKTPRRRRKRRKLQCCVNLQHAKRTGGRTRKRTRKSRDKSARNEESPTTTGQDSSNEPSRHRFSSPEVKPEEF